VPDAVGYIAGAARGTGLDAISVVARAGFAEYYTAAETSWVDLTAELSRARNGCQEAGPHGRRRSVRDAGRKMSGPGRG